MARIAAVLAEARTAGLAVRVEADQLVIRGPKSQAALAQQLLAEKRTVLALLAAEEDAVAWRVAAMGPQVPERGPIPFLVARPIDPKPGSCASCGEPLLPQQTLRCEPCVQAAWFVLNAVREGVAP